MADASLDASRGEDKFKGAAVKHMTIGVLYPNVMHVVTTEASGIKTMADLKGKRVSTGSPGSATEVMASACWRLPVSTRTRTSSVNVSAPLSRPTR
jgi:TRAP-type uncharacterized transport system substrate-binding protein